MKYKKKYNQPVSNIRYKFLKKLYLANPITKRLFYCYINRYEGGQFYSNTLRRIFFEIKDVKVGIGTYGCFTDGFRPHVDIGSYCSIAPGVQRLVGNHPYTNVSTHPLFYHCDFGGVKEMQYNEHKLIIGNDVWIGVNAIITGNVEYIGDGAVIGAGAVVTHNVGAYEIVAGVPAKVIGKRFEEDNIKKIVDSEWWKLTPDQLLNSIVYSDDIDRFVNSILEQRK